MRQRIAANVAKVPELLARAFDFSNYLFSIDLDQNRVPNIDMAALR